MSDPQSPLEHISKTQYLIDANDFMQDEDFQNCIDLALKCIVKPEVPNGKVVPLIVELQAYSLKFRLGYVTYMTINKGTTGASNKKNIYRSTYEGIDKLVEALKYTVKV